MRRLMPPAALVREALAKILASDTFARSERSREFLRYLVEREQAGESERLKGYAIGIDVFGRDAEFDPATDAVVRVQAGRLRELLGQYYESEGADAPIRILIPRGGYVPVYTELEQASATDEASANADAPPPLKAGRASASGGWRRSPAMSGRTMLAAAAVVVAIMLSGVAYLQFGRPDPASVGSVPADIDEAGSLGLPAVHIVARDTDDSTQRVAAVLRNALPGFDTVDFLARMHADEIGQRGSAAHFIFEVGQRAGQSSVGIDLLHADTGKVLLARSVSFEGDSATIDPEIADILTSTLPVSGTIYAYLAEFGPRSALTRCLLLGNAYFRDQREQRHREACECFLALEEEGPGSALIPAELSALILEAVTDRYAFPENASIDNALALAREAVQLGPTSPYAHRSYGYLLTRTGNQDEALRWMRKSYDLNPYDLGMAASYAYALIFGGEYELGIPLMARAVEASSAHAIWWDYGLFLGYFMLDDLDHASRAASALATTDRAHYVAARAIVAHADGRIRQRDELLAKLASISATFVADPEGYYRRANYPADMAKKLVDALRTAGLSTAS